VEFADPIDDSWQPLCAKAAGISENRRFGDVLAGELRRAGVTVREVPGMPTFVLPDGSTTHTFGKYAASLMLEDGGRFLVMKRQALGGCLMVLRLCAETTSSIVVTGVTLGRSTLRSPGIRSDAVDRKYEPVLRSASPLLGEALECVSGDGEQGLPWVRSWLAHAGISVDAAVEPTWRFASGMPSVHAWDGGQLVIRPLAARSLLTVCITCDPSDDVPALRAEVLVRATSAAVGVIMEVGVECDPSESLACEH
jgi:hypothetical protein